MALITAVMLREHYPQIVGTDEDSLLEDLIDEAERILAEWCGWPRTSASVHSLETATYILYLPPRVAEPRVIDLPHPLVSAITTAHVDENMDYGDETLVTSTDYVHDTNTRELWLKPSASASWSRAPRANKLTIVAGFPALGGVGIISTIAAQVRHLLFLRRAQSVTNHTQAGQSSTRTDLDQIVPAVVQSALAPLRVWSSSVG